MPYCKHIAVHATVNKSLAYILNPEKTDELTLTTSINCMTNAEQAYDQMRLVYEQFARDNFNSPPPLNGKGSVKAIHYIQSFSPEENVSPEVAHMIAKAFVIKNFGEDAQAVISTHVNTNCVHSHIIVNSYSLNGKKFYANKGSLKQVRKNSDELCRAFGVAVSPKLNGKGRSIAYNEWEHRRKGTSWKEQIRQAIDELIPTVNSLEDLLHTLEERGYEIKHGKYISIKALDQGRFVRTKTLGEEYTEDSLNIRILYRDMGSGITPVQDNESKLREAYVAILGDVRILAEQRKKVPRKRIITAEYSVENDLDVYKLSAQLSVINKESIVSIGDLEGRITKLRTEFEKLRQEINNYIEEHNRMVSLLEQAKEYFALSKKDELSASEQLKLNICRQAINENGIMTTADTDRLREHISHLDKKISAIREKLDSCRKQYDVFCDIRETYKKISNGDYISNLAEEERLRREKEKQQEKRKTNGR